MKKTKRVALLCATTVVCGFLSACDHPPKNHLRQRRDADGQLMYDVDGNPIYEDDDKQYYTYSGGHYYPWYTRANGYSTIPGSGLPAPNVSGGLGGSEIEGSSSSVSRGGFGESGGAHGASGEAGE